MYDGSCPMDSTGLHLWGLPGSLFGLSLRKEPSTSAEAELGAPLRGLVDEKSAGGGTLGTNDVQGGAHEEVTAGGDAPQVESFQNDDTTGQQRLVHLVSLYPEAFDGQVIDAGKPCAAVGESPGGIGGESDEVGVKVRVIPKATV